MAEPKTDLDTRNNDASRAGVVEFTKTSKRRRPPQRGGEDGSAGGLEQAYDVTDKLCRAVNPAFHADIAQKVYAFAFTFDSAAKLLEYGAAAVRTPAYGSTEWRRRTALLLASRDEGVEPFEALAREDGLAIDAARHAEMSAKYADRLRKAATAETIANDPSLFCAARVMVDDMAAGRLSREDVALADRDATRALLQVYESEIQRRVSSDFGAGLLGWRVSQPQGAPRPAEQWRSVDGVSTIDSVIGDLLNCFEDADGAPAKEERLLALLAQLRDLGDSTADLTRMLDAVAFIQEAANAELPKAVFPPDEKLPKQDALDAFVVAWWKKHYRPCARAGILTTTYIRDHDLRYEGRLRRVASRAGAVYFDGAQSIAELIRREGGDDRLVAALSAVAQCEPDRFMELFGGVHRRRPKNGGAARSVRRMPRTTDV